MEQSVIVRKNVKLMSGESITAYAEKISNAYRSWVRKELNIQKNNPDTYIYTIDVFDSDVVGEVIKYESSDRIQKYYACSYTRKSNDEFEFKNLAEVERVISFKPKSTKLKPVTKSLSIEDFGWVTKKLSWKGFV